MGIRTDSVSVQAILRPGTNGGDYDNENNPDLDPYIAAASAMVDQVVALAANGDYGWSSFKAGIASDTATLLLIETWLAAHFYQQSDQGYTSRSTQGASGSFQGNTSDKGLCGTKYGQSALRLDYSGMLTILDKRQFAGAISVGGH